MAEWTVFPSKSGNLNLSYKNSITGQKHQCGEVRLDTPREMIVKWVVEQELNPGDLVKFDGLTLAVYLKEGLA